MNIHKLYSFLFKAGGFREKRMALFSEIIQPTTDTKILDIGGTLGNWHYLDATPSITLLNLDTNHDRTDYPKHVTFHEGDALNLPFPNGHFDVSYSNSVIEHVHTWENQQRFAEEARRVGQRLWVQTPAYEFFLEPHFITPFIHWFPAKARQRLLRNFTVWGWIQRPTQADVNNLISEIRLLKRHEMETLFPDCEIFVEKWMGMPKSYVAYRT